MKSSMAFEGVNAALEACVDCLVSVGAEPGLSYCGLGRAEEEEAFEVEVEVRDISLCDLRCEGSHCRPD